MGHSVLGARYNRSASYSETTAINPASMFFITYQVRGIVGMKYNPYKYESLF
jgi:hypothetical protein